MENCSKIIQNMNLLLFCVSTWPQKVSLSTFSFMVDEQGPSFRDVMREEIVARFIGLCRIFKDNFYGTRVIEFLVVFF